MTGWYTNGLPHGRALRVRISELATPADFRDAVCEFFEGLERPAGPNPPRSGRTPDSGNSGPPSRRFVIAP